MAFSQLDDMTVPVIGSRIGGVALWLPSATRAVLFVMTH
jgi:hypothetical protein